jgi:cytochrome c peroxidase
MRAEKSRDIWAGLSSTIALAAAGLALMMTGIVAACGSGKAPAFRTESDVTPAADSIGERLFLDTRFAQYFAAHMTGVNDPLDAGDPVVQTVENAGGTLPGPFAGQSINCRSCHFVTEFQGVANAGNRTYADFTTRSPIPRAMGSFDHTPRNAMQMVGSLQPHTGPALLHFDGEFATPEALVEGTLTGRNFGWAPTQSAEALAHIARVIREDDGSSQLATDRTNGLSYGVLMLGTDSRITSDLKLPSSQRLDVKTASDQQILDEVAMMISTYMRDLLFSQDEFGRYIGSPYDNFLRVNHLPVQPLAGETKAAYNQRLYSQLVALTNPTYITAKDGSFQYHTQTYQFGPQELAGLLIFLKIGSAAGGDDQHAGNCAACHQAPDFTDFQFHTTGVSQDEYDAVWGAGSFLNLHIPALAERTANFNQYMPASAQHPDAIEAFRHAVSAQNPAFADLGAWNVYLNPDMPGPQATLKSLACVPGKDCSVDQGLANTIAQFKTPTLRDLEDSAPYFHNGSRAKFEDVVAFYVSSAQLAHQGALRNAPAEFANMHLTQSDIAALAAFLKSLTEDYDDA